MLGFQIPYSADEINAASRELLRRQKLTDAYVRPIAWRGSEMMGVSAQNNTIHLAIAAWEWPSYFAPEQRLKGIRLDMAEWRRPDPRTIPSKAKAAGLYMICTLSKHAAENKGYADALMLDYQGNVAEATGANVFFVQDGRIHTPEPHCFLDGITRRTVIELAKRRGIEVVERRIAPEEMAGFTECFLTGHRRRGDAGLRDRPLRLRAGRDHPHADGRLRHRRAARQARRRRLNRLSPGTTRTLPPRGGG